MCSFFFLVMHSAHKPARAKSLNHALFADLGANSGSRIWRKPMGACSREASVKIFAKSEIPVFDNFFNKASLSDEEAMRYLRGEELASEGDNGFAAVLHHGIALGGGKRSGGRLKNHYPKGLRNQ